MAQRKHVREAVHAVIAHARSFFLKQAHALTHLGKPPVIGGEINAILGKIVALTAGNR